MYRIALSYELGDKYAKTYVSKLAEQLQADFRADDYKSTRNRSGQPGADIGTAEGEDVVHSEGKDNSEGELPWRVVCATTAINRD